MLVKIYRSTARYGSIIATELITEIDILDSIDLQEIAEQNGGDLAVVEEEEFVNN